MTDRNVLFPRLARGGALTRGIAPWDLDYNINIRALSRFTAAGDPSFRMWLSRFSLGTSIPFVCLIHFNISISPWFLVWNEERYRDVGIQQDLIDIHGLLLLLLPLLRSLMEDGVLFLPQTAAQPRGFASFDQYRS